MGWLQSCLFPSCNCTSGCRPRKVHPGRGSKPSCNQHFFRWDFVEALVGALYVTGGEVHKATPCLAFFTLIFENSDRAVTPTRSQNITCITISIIAATIALLTHFPICVLLFSLGFLTHVSRRTCSFYKIASFSNNRSCDTNCIYMHLADPYHRHQKGAWFLSNHSAGNQAFLWIGSPMNIDYGMHIDLPLGDL